MRKTGKLHRWRGSGTPKTWSKGSFQDDSVPVALQKLFSALFRPRSRVQRILQAFQGQRQQLQEQFFAMASASGKPRGLSWKNCDWLDTYVLVDDTQPGMLTMFCGVNVSFEAVAGGDMEGIDAVAMIRDGSAVFHHQNGRWGTGGRVLFNMNPRMAADTMARDQPVLSCSEG